MTLSSSCEQHQSTWEMEPSHLRFQRLRQLAGVHFTSLSVHHDSHREPEMHRSKHELRSCCIPEASFSKEHELCKTYTYPFSLFSFLMRSTTEVCHSCVPWHIFKRATFIPFVANVSSISSLHVAGPMVATIFVRLVLRKPASKMVLTYEAS